MLDAQRYTLNTAPMETEYRLHGGARAALYIVSALCFILVVAIPIAIWVAIRTAGGKIVLSPNGVVAKGLLTTEFSYADVERLGTCKVPILAKGIGGALAKQRVGGDNAINVVVKLKNNKTRKIIASSYEKYEEIMATISQRIGKPYEQLTMGAFGMKWPT